MAAEGEMEIGGAGRCSCATRRYPHRCIAEHQSCERMNTSFKIAECQTIIDVIRWEKSKLPYWVDLPATKVVRILPRSLDAARKQCSVSFMATEPRAVSTLPESSESFWKDASKL
jgi:hypothetical protein